MKLQSYKSQRYEITKLRNDKKTKFRNHKITKLQNEIRKNYY